MLLAYIENSKKFHDKDENEDETQSVTSTDSQESDATVSHTNSSNRYSALNMSNKKRTVNNGLDGYKKTPSKHVVSQLRKVPP